MKPLAILVPYS